MFTHLFTTGKAETLHQIPVCSGPICPSHLRLPRQVPAEQWVLLSTLCPGHSAPLCQRVWATTDSGRGVCIRRAPLILQLCSVPAGPADSEGAALRTPLEADAPPVPPLPHTVRSFLPARLYSCKGHVLCLEGLLTWGGITVLHIQTNYKWSIWLIVIFFLHS